MPILFNIPTRSTNSDLVINTVIPASEWVGDSAPFTNTLEIDGIRPNSVIELTIPNDFDYSLLDHYQNALIMGKSQEENKLVIEARGIKPTIDLPILLIVRNAIVGKRLVSNTDMSETTTFNDDGSITTSYENGNSEVTEFKDDGSIVVSSYNADSELVKTATTTFNEDGSISTTVKEEL